MLKNYCLIFFTFCLLLFFDYSCNNKSIKQIESPTVIDFNLVGNWIFINVKLNHAEQLNFILDSGVDETIINKRTANRLGLRFDKKDYLDAALSFDSVYYSENNSIKIGDLKLDSLILVQVPLENLEETFGVIIDGFIGEALFKKFIINIDFKKNKIQIYKQNQSLLQDSLFSMNLEIIDRLPVVETSFIVGNNEKLTGKFIIDLGNKNSIAFCAPYINKHNLFNKMGPYYVFNATGMIANKKSYMTRMKSFQFGNYKIDSVPFMLSQSNEGTLSSTKYDGIIGMDIFTRFSSIGFDYKNKKLYLGKYKYQPDSKFSEINCSGLELKLDATTQKIYINAVYENSPASEAKLNVGDELKRINGIDVQEFQFTEIKKMFREKNKTIDIEVIRAKRVLQFKLNLRELI